MDISWIHPDTQKVLDYPETLGKAVALKYFCWEKLDRTEEAYISSKLLYLAKLIDKENNNQFGNKEI